jgi:17beta-estradiol 17-dehydrogenase / very-long-chain 3-oxoacyl-CoA reductase
MDLGAILEKIPKPVVLAFTALGAIVAAGKVFSYVRLLLSLFVLPGTNVSLHTEIKRVWKC